MTIKIPAVLQEFLSEYDGINIARAKLRGMKLEWRLTTPDLVIVDLWMPDRAAWS